MLQNTHYTTKWKEILGRNKNPYIDLRSVEGGHGKTNQNSTNNKTILTLLMTTLLQLTNKYWIHTPNTSLLLPNEYNR